MQLKVYGEKTRYPYREKIKFEMLLLLAKMKGYERHFEWYFYVIKYCLHYLGIKLFFHELSSSYSFCEDFDQG